jgi:hypothetical protein
VDKIIRDWQNETVFAHSFTVYHANWSLHGKPAGPLRNGHMLHGTANSLEPHPGVKADRLLALPQPDLDWWAAKSGTGDCIKQAFKAGIHLDIPGYRND